MAIGVTMILTAELLIAITMVTVELLPAITMITAAPLLPAIITIAVVMTADSEDGDTITVVNSKSKTE